jgi:hypothetical protein
MDIYSYCDTIFYLRYLSFWDIYEGKPGRGDRRRLG